eukprot:156543_1
MAYNIPKVPKGLSDAQFAAWVNQQQPVVNTITEQAKARVDAKVKRDAKQQRNPNNAIVKGVLGIAVMGVAAAVGAQVIKADMVAKGQAEWGSYEAAPKKKSGICDLCTEPTISGAHSHYCSYHTWRLSNQ